MSVKFLAIHTTRQGDTVASLAREYRLSSPLAITSIPSNQSVRAILLNEGELPQGMVINIPPNAGQIARERIYALQCTMPAFHAHFDEMQLLIESKLQRVVLAAERPFESDAVRDVLSEMHEIVATGINVLAGQTVPLVEICQGMAHTHVAEWTDNAAVEACKDSLCGLYWAITPGALELWQEMWTEDIWSNKWQDKESEAAWLLATQYLNTVRSVVVQQIDRRIRDTHSLERNLQSEASE